MPTDQRVLVVWRLDRLGRNLKHLVTLLRAAVGIAFVSLGEGIDCTTAAGRLQLHALPALAEFERARIAERVRAGLARVRASGKRLGRPAANLALADIMRTAHLSVRDAAANPGGQFDLISGLPSDGDTRQGLDGGDGVPQHDASLSS